MAYLTLANSATHETEIKGSRFLALVAACDSSEEAEMMIAAARREHPHASHHCWAYRVGNSSRFSDDGEPGGTAGRPMLEVMLKRNLDHLVGVVTRYFGGTKLGAGGLARAYSGTLARALDGAGERLVQDRQAFRLQVPFEVSGALFSLTTNWPGLRQSEPQYTSAGLILEVSIEAPRQAAFLERLRDVSRGRARAEIIKES